MSSQPNEHVMKLFADSNFFVLLDLLIDKVLYIEKECYEPRRICEFSSLHPSCLGDIIRGFRPVYDSGFFR